MALDKEYWAARERHRRRMNVIHAVQLFALAALVAAHIYKAFNP